MGQNANPLAPAPVPGVDMIAATPLDIDTMGRTLWGEARNQGAAGMTAVGWVIRNRFEQPGWWSRNDDDIPDDTIAAVCMDPWQFSCNNENDANYQKCRDVNGTNKVFRQAQAITAAVLGGMTPDPTGGADHYCRTDWIERTKWARTNKDKITRVIGAHTFFKLQKTPKPLAKSRTMAGLGAAGASTVATGAAVITDVAKQIEPLAGYSHYIMIGFLALSLVGIAWAAYAKFDDHRNEVTG